MRLRKADQLFSKAMKCRWGWTCARCGKKYPEGSRGIHLAHFHGRRKESVRFDPENVNLLCYGCHSYFHQNPKEHELWKIKQLGQKRFDLLTLRANTYCKRDDKMVELYYKKKIK